ncbi:MAG: transporter substrate-binding domain-containing protein, partial [Clostridiales Family XIII bacterium]|nr:transporter substrate-binding domain-containing protein [Clostridiales Family XIII bacterium]
MKRLVTWLAVAACVCGLAACAPADAQPETIQVYTDFREIPGVTAGEIAAVEALVAKYGGEGFSYGMFESTETYPRADGTIGGYSALFCDWMSELFGIRFVPQMDDWDTLYNGLLDGTIDFTGELTATPEREELFAMTRPFTERAIVAYRQVGSQSLDEIAKVRPLRFVFLTGSSTADLILESSPYDIEPLYADSLADVTEMMLTGEPADAFLGEEHGRATMAEGVYAEDIFPVVYSPSSFSTGQPELAPIVAVLDKYLAQGGLEYLLELYNEGNEDYARDRLYSEFTEEERAYIAAHGEGGAPVRLIAETDNYPVCFYNENEGAWQGIAISVLDRICAFTGLRYEVVNPQDADWRVNLEELEDGDADMVSELLYSDTRSGRFLWTDAPYAEDMFSLISLIETEDMEVNEILYSTVGVVAGSAYEDFFRKWFPDHPSLVLCDDTADALAKLKSHEVDVVMASRNLLLNASNYLEDPSFKNNLVFQFSYGSYFGLSRGGTTLCSILSKAQAYVDTETIADRWTERVFDYRAKFARQQVMYLTILSALFVVIIVLLVISVQRRRRAAADLERTVRERTAELEIQTEAAKVASAAKGDFLSRMSHEIRTPLNAIMGMAQIAKRSAETESPKTVHAIDEMLGASHHLLGILNDVLDMSKIEAGKLVLNDKPFALRAALHDVESIIGQRCCEKDVVFDAEIEVPEDLVVVGDALYLKQILINLLGNSVKFTEPGGTVSLEVRTGRETDEAAAVSFTVADTGIGMSREQIEKLFLPFEQTDAGIASQYGGSGLGLAISQNLVRAMGGEDIAVESEKGTGSTFRFSLELPKATAPDGAEEAGAGAVIAQKDWGGKRVLMAEDIEINRVIVREFLDGTGVRVDEAADGEEAVRRFTEAPEGTYDAILMDIQMPRLDGYGA